MVEKVVTGETKQGQTSQNYLKSFLLRFDGTNGFDRAAETRTSIIHLHPLGAGGLLLTVNSILDLLLDLGNQFLQLIYFTDSRAEGISFEFVEQGVERIDGGVEILDGFVVLAVVAESHPELVLSLGDLPHVGGQLVLPLLEAGGEVLHGLGVVLVLDADLPQGEEGVAMLLDVLQLAAGRSRGSRHTGVDGLG